MEGGSTVQTSLRKASSQTVVEYHKDRAGTSLGPLDATSESSSETASRLQDRTEPLTFHFASRVNFDKPDKEVPIFLLRTHNKFCDITVITQ